MPRRPAKTRGLYLRGTTYWLDYIDAAGQRRRESARTSSKIEAKAVLAQRRADAAAGNDTPKRVRPHVFRDIIDDYEEWCCGQRGYRFGKKSRLKRIRADLGHLAVTALTTQRIDTYLASLDVSPATRNRYLANISACVRQAVRWGMAPDSCVRAVQAAHRTREAPDVATWLTVAEIRSLERACDPRIHDVVTLALNTGMRRGEILGLTPAMVDTTQRTIRLPITKAGKPRTIHLNDKALAAVKRMAIPVPMSTRFLHTLFKRAVEAAGIGRNVRFHDLRHTFCSHMVMDGADLITIAEMTGHSTLGMLRRYSHLADTHVRKYLSALYK